MAAAGHGETAAEGSWNLFRCFCRWRLCSDSIHRVVPGRDYLRVQDGAADDDRPLWSVLVGCTALQDPFHNIRLHRFRVASSGRVIGRSDDMLQPFVGVHPDNDDDNLSPDTIYRAGAAALAPDGRRLHVICDQDDDDDSSSPPTTFQAEEDKPRGKNLITCCRKYLIERGELEAWTAVQCKVVTKPVVYFICQVDQHSYLYQISTSEGKLTCDKKLLEPLLCLETDRAGDVGIDDPVSWHYIDDGPDLLVISSSPYKCHYKVNVRSNSYRLIRTKHRDGIHFTAVLRAGTRIVALDKTLRDVYILDQRTSRWIQLLDVYLITLDLGQTVNIYGFVDLVDGDRFLISDAETDKCFLLSMRRREWFAVEPPAGNDWFGWVGFLRWRCMFDEGLMYTWSDEGLVAIELVKKGEESSTSYRLGMLILLEFPWRQFSDTKFMSFECIGKNTGSGDLVFCVIEGYFTADPFTIRHSLTATTVIVERREDAQQGKMVPFGINHVDVAVSSVEHKGWILTNYAFAL